MTLALRTRQPYLDVLSWHPRDVDTAYRLLLDQAEAQQVSAREDRFAAMRQQLLERMNNRGR
jgi:hypothetical protein